MDTTAEVNSTTPQHVHDTMDSRVGELLGLASSWPYLAITLGWYAEEALN